MCTAAGGLLVASAGAQASPCDGLATTLSSTGIATAIAKQLHVDSVRVQQAYTSGDWSLIYVVTSDVDQTFLIYSDDPVNNRYVTLWGGAPTDYQEPQVREWAQTNVPDMPVPLASCFAWYVLQDRQPQL